MSHFAVLIIRSSRQPLVGLQLRRSRWVSCLRGQSIFVHAQSRDYSRRMVFQVGKKRQFKITNRIECFIISALQITRSKEDVILCRDNTFPNSFLLWYFNMFELQISQGNIIQCCVKRNRFQIIFCFSILLSPGLY